MRVAIRPAFRGAIRLGVRPGDRFAMRVVSRVRDRGPSCPVLALPVLKRTRPAIHFSETTSGNGNFSFCRTSEGCARGEKR